MTKEEFKAVFLKCSFIDKFKGNLKNMPMDRWDDFDTYAYNTQTYRWVRDAFTWEDTDEGDEFWRSVDKCWVTFTESEDFSEIMNWYKPSRRVENKRNKLNFKL